MAGEGAPSRLGIRTPNWLGDAVMALPAMAAVRRALPEAWLTIAAPAGIAPLFEEETPAGPDAVLKLEAGVEERAVLAAAGLDAILLLPNSFRSAWVARGAGIPGRWGFGGGPRGWLLTSAVPRPRTRVHQAEYYLTLVRGVLDARAADARLTPDTTGTNPRIVVGSDTARRAEALLAREGIDPSTPVAGFAPGAAYGHAKRWPPRRVAGVIARLALEHGMAAVLVGAAGDRDAGREIESALPPRVRVTNLIGRTDLRLLIGVLGRCSAFVSNDSGAMHVASAVGVPVVAVFGPTDERVTAPLGGADVLVNQVFCRPCMLRDCPIDHRCMKGISEDAVFAAVAARVRPRGVEGGP